MIIKKCAITGCIFVATRVPIMTVATSIIKSKNFIAPLTLTFDPVCGAHQSTCGDDYFTMQQMQDTTASGIKRGWKFHWNMVRIRFAEIGWKPEQGGKMKLADITQMKGVNIKWSGQKGLRNRN